MSKTEKTKSITQKIAELDKQVEWFYSDDFSLDRALSQYKTASQLASEIEQDLSELKNQVEILEDFTKN